PGHPRRLSAGAGRGLVRLAPGKLDGRPHAPPPLRLDEELAVDLAERPAGDEPTRGAAGGGLAGDRAGAGSEAPAASEVRALVFPVLPGWGPSPRLLPRLCHSHRRLDVGLQPLRLHRLDFDPGEAPFADIVMVARRLSEGLAVERGRGA